MNKTIINSIIPSTQINIQYKNFNKTEKMIIPDWYNKLYTNYLKGDDLETVYLTNHDFIHGTYRILKPGKYVITEDIIFNPNPNNNFKPTKYQKNDYNKLTYSLGFFAAITIESVNVIIDLNGNTIKQSKDHYFNQRFYSNIELGNSPFTPGNGPSDFGNTFVSCKNVIIDNGTLGLSSHHGIHGNNSTNLIFKNLKILDYEVGGISLNGCNKIICNDITLKNIQNINFNHRLVHLIICLPFLELLQKKDSKAFFNNKPISEYIQETKKEINLLETITRNDSKLVDGNAYGLSFNGEGPVIGDFKNKTKHYTAYNIFIYNITIESIKTNAIEVLGYTKKYPNIKNLNNLYNRPILKGPIGQVFDIKNCMDSDNKYSRNILSDIQLLLSKYNIISSIDRQIVEWAENGSSLVFNPLRVVYGIDNMNHTMKGNIGIFFSNVKDSSIQNVRIKEMVNMSKKNNYEHHGLNNYGVAIAGSENISVNNVTLDKSHSNNGKDKLLLTI